MTNLFVKARSRQARKEPKSDEYYADRLITFLDPSGSTSEAYRSLRTNLLYAQVDNPPKVIVVTSPRQGEGKSTTTANLAVVLAQAGKRVLLLDCDFRIPVIHKFFGLHNFHGMTDILVGEKSLQEVWKEPIEGLKVVPVGPIPLDPAEVLGSQRFSNFLTSVRKEFDYVLLDASPVRPVSDPLVIAVQGDAVLVVLDAQNSRKIDVRRTVHDLKTIGANVLGVVMNNLPISEQEKYSYYHYGY
jgi:capsular exopolysaccharide synthesis family protein